MAFLLLLVYGWVAVLLLGVGGALAYGGEAFLRRWQARKEHRTAGRSRVQIAHLRVIRANPEQVRRVGGF